MDTRTETKFPHHERLEGFLTLHSAGFNLIPATRDKIPKVQWKHLQTVRQSVAELSSHYYANTSGDFLLLTGFRAWDKTGIVVVDADDEAAIKEVERRCPPTPLRVETGRGRQYYYRHPGEGIRVQQVIGVAIDGVEHKIDIKGDGNAVIAPGSVHKTGKTYTASVSITAESIAALPVFDRSWLPHEGRLASSIGQDHEVLGEDQGNHEQLVAADWLPPVEERVREARAYLAKVPGTTAGRGEASNAALCLARRVAWGFAVPFDEALDLLEEWGLREDQLDDCGFYNPWKHKEIGHKLRSAIAKGCECRVGWKLSAVREAIEADLRAEGEAEMRRRCRPFQIAPEVIPEGPEPDVESGSTGEPQESDPYRADLDAAKIPIEAKRVVGKVVHYMAPCPCCGLVGAFWWHLESFEAGHKCGAGKRSWIDGKKLWSRTEAHQRRGYLLDNLDEIASPRWQVRDHFAENSLVLLYGASNVGKSFKALDLGLSIATGRDYLGKHPVLPGSVLYVVGEGIGGIRKRVRAWRKKHGHERKIDNFAVIPAQFDLSLGGEAEAEEILRITSELLARSPSLIILDTLNRHFGGGDENNTKDMTSFVKTCDILRERSGGTVVVVHHSGRDTEKGERGNIALRNAADTVIACKAFGEREGMVVACKKQKDSEFFEDYLLLREVVDLGEDVTSLVFKLGDEQPPDKNSRYDRLRNDEEMILSFAPEGEENATTRGQLMEETKSRLLVVGMEPIGEKRIRTLINTLVMRHKLIETSEPNPKHRRVYRPQGGFFEAA